MKYDSYILGISAYYHDSAACLIKNGDIVAAAQEERFTRTKHDSSFPANAINYCLQEEQITSKDLNYVGYYEQPYLKFKRILSTFLHFSPKGCYKFCDAMSFWTKKKLHIKRIIRKNLKYSGEIIFCDHHESHAASAFYPSPFDDAAILTVDGVGEWATTTIGYGIHNKCNLLKEIHFPHSIGLLYAAFTYYCGFKVNSGEYKLMGLAPYGNPIYKDQIYKMIDVKEDGSFRLDLSYFDFCVGPRMISGKFTDLFQCTARDPESTMYPFYKNIAASIQEVTNEIMLKLANAVFEYTPSRNLVMAGGVALNCTANSYISKHSKFKNIWIQPAAGDAGGALGVALHIWHKVCHMPRQAKEPDSQNTSLLGPQYELCEISTTLNKLGANYHFYISEKELLEDVSKYISDGQIVGWFHGRMEFGPRALGSRSILGDARDANMQRKMNLKIKFRESFRPFAPSVLNEHAYEYFDMADSPYMLFITNVHKKDIPAVTHVDGSARLQTVDSRFGRYHRLLQKFREVTGCPLFINTSFNVRGEPIVCTPEDAYRCFMNTDIDVLVLDSFVMIKEDQTAVIKQLVFGKD